MPGHDDHGRVGNGLVQARKLPGNARFLALAHGGEEKYRAAHAEAVIVGGKRLVQSAGGKIELDVGHSVHRAGEDAAEGLFVVSGNGVYGDGRNFRHERGEQTAEMRRGTVDAAVEHLHGNAFFPAGGQKPGPQFGFQQRHHARRSDGQRAAHDVGIVERRKAHDDAKRGMTLFQIFESPFRNVAALPRPGGDEHPQRARGGKMFADGHGKAGFAARRGLKPEVDGVSVCGSVFRGKPVVRGQPFLPPVGEA